MVIEYNYLVRGQKISRSIKNPGPLTTADMEYFMKLVSSCKNYSGFEITLKELT